MQFFARIICCLNLFAIMTTCNATVFLAFGKKNKAKDSNSICNIANILTFILSLIIATALLTVAYYAAMYLYYIVLQPSDSIAKPIKKPQSFKIQIDFLLEDFSLYMKSDELLSEGTDNDYRNSFVEFDFLNSTDPGCIIRKDNCVQRSYTLNLNDATPNPHFIWKLKIDNLQLSDALETIISYQRSIRKKRNTNARIPLYLQKFLHNVDKNKLQAKKIKNKDEGLRIANTTSSFLEPYNSHLLMRKLLGNKGNEKSEIYNEKTILIDTGSTEISNKFYNEKHESIPATMLQVPKIADHSSGEFLNSKENIDDKIKDNGRLKIQENTSISENQSGMKKTISDKQRKPKRSVLNILSDIDLDEYDDHFYNSKIPNDLENAVVENKIDQNAPSSKFNSNPMKNAQTTQVYDDFKEQNNIYSVVEVKPPGESMYEEWKPFPFQKDNRLPGDNFNEQQYFNQNNKANVQDYERNELNDRSNLNMQNELNKRSYNKNNIEINNVNIHEFKYDIDDLKFGALSNNNTPHDSKLSKNIAIISTDNNDNVNNKKLNDMIDNSKYIIEDHNLYTMLTIANNDDNMKNSLSSKYETIDILDNNNDDSSLDISSNDEFNSPFKDSGNLLFGISSVNDNNNSIRVERNDNKVINFNTISSLEKPSNQYVANDASPHYDENIPRVEHDVLSNDNLPSNTLLVANTNDENSSDRSEANNIQQSMILVNHLKINDDNIKPYDGQNSLYTSKLIKNQNIIDSPNNIKTIFPSINNELLNNNNNKIQYRNKLDLIDNKGQSMRNNYDENGNNHDTIVPNGIDIFKYNDMYKQNNDYNYNIELMDATNEIPNNKPMSAHTVMVLNDPLNVDVSNSEQIDIDDIDDYTDYD